jgi:hypothetical protein
MLFYTFFNHFESLPGPHARLRTRGDTVKKSTVVRISNR